MTTQPRKPKHRGTVPDDRGETRPVISVGELFKDARMSDPRFAAVFERAMRLKMSGYRMGVQVALTVGLAVVVVLGLRWLGFLRTPGLSGGIVGVTSAVVTILMLRRGEKTRAPEIARTLLADGVCPSCSYGLVGLPLEQDGCHVCPECGSAWKSERVLRNEAFVEGRSNSVQARGLAALWRDGVGLGAVRIADDSGVVRPLVSGRLRRQIAVAEGERRDRLRAAAKRNARCGLVLRIGIGGFYLVVGIAAPFIGASLLAGKVGVLLGVVFGLFAIGFGLAMLRGPAGISAPWVRREMLARGLCPSCAADLPHGEGGEQTVACAECGAVWSGAGTGNGRDGAGGKPMHGRGE